MAITVTNKQTGETGELSQVLKGIHKEFGAEIGGKGVKPKLVRRIGTGIFPFDLATGGGFPKGRISIVFGMESSGKTNLALLACASVQKHCAVCGHLKDSCTCKEGPTILKAVFIDMEQTFDAWWAAQMGVNVDEIVLLQPDYAEQAADILEAVLHAADVGIVVLDSIAAMTTSSMIEGSTEKAEVGGSALVVSKMVKKVTAAFAKESKRDHTPALICINQIRTKIGVMFGNPETTPGGNLLRFASSLTVRVSASEEIDKSISEVMPTYKVTSCILRKWKVPIIGKNFEYKLCVLPHEGMRAGEVADWNMVSNHLKDYGMLGKNDKGGKWFCIDSGGELAEYATLGAVNQRYSTDPAFNKFLKDLIIREESKKSGFPVEGGDPVG